LKKSPSLKNIKLNNIDNFLNDIKIIDDDDNDHDEKVTKIENYIIKKKIGDGAEGIVLLFLIFLKY
jgi:hypothetical protein